jgi:hypothetical protein
MIMPIFAQTITLALIIAYSFAILGHSMFGPQSEYFSTPSMSVLTMLQLFFGVDFRIVVEKTQSTASTNAYLFFIAFYVIGVLIVCNLINTIIIQFYSDSLNERSLSSFGTEKEHNKKLGANLINRFKQMEVLNVWKKVKMPDVSSVTIVQSDSARDLRYAMTTSVC